MCVCMTSDRCSEFVSENISFTKDVYCIFNRSLLIPSVGWEYEMIACWVYTYIWEECVKGRV